MQFDFEASSGIRCVQVPIDLVTEGLRDLITDDAYELQLDPSVAGTTAELEEFAGQVIQTIRAKFLEIRAGEHVGSSPGRSPLDLLAR